MSAHALQAGFGEVEVLLIHTDYWRFYRLLGEGDPGSLECRVGLASPLRGLDPNLELPGGRIAFRRFLDDARTHGMIARRR